MTTVHISSNPINSNAQDYTRDWEVTNYQHRITATIGFDACSFDLLSNKNELEEFFFNGLGRRITRYSRDGNFTCWDGQIVEMTLVQPGVNRTISLNNMFNRVSVRYTPIDTTANPPTESAETSTAVVNNTASQDRYGIKQIVHRPAHIDRLTAADAAQLANSILQQYKLPRRDGQKVSGSNDSRLLVKCEGYMHTLKWRVYNQTASSSTSNANVVIGAVITAVGQFIDSTSLDSNSTAVQNYFNRDDTAFDIIRLIASLGDSSYNRWVAHILEDRKLIYKKSFTITTYSIDYFQRMGDPRQEIKNISGRVIPGWEIRPDKWLRTVDLYPFEPTPATLPEDYQAMYIESVQWIEPDDLILDGSTGNNLQVLFARQANQGDRLL